MSNQTSFDLYIQAKRRQSQNAIDKGLVPQTNPNDLFINNPVNSPNFESDISDNYSRTHRTLDEIGQDAGATLMGSFATTGDNLATAFGVARHAIGLGEGTLDDTIKDSTYYTQNAKHYWNEQHSIPFKQKQAEASTIDKNENLTELDRAIAKAKFYLDNPAHAVELGAGSLVSSGSQLLLGGIAGRAVGLAPKANQLANSFLLGSTSYIAEENETGKVTKDSLAYATLYGSLSALINSNNKSLEALITGSYKSGGKKGLSEFLSAVGVEGSTELLDETSSRIIHNIENNRQWYQGIGSSAVDGAVLGSVSGAIANTPKAIVGSAHLTNEVSQKLQDKANQVIQDKLDPYDYETHSNIDSDKYQPVRVFDELTKAINTADSNTDVADLVAKRDKLGIDLYERYHQLQEEITKETDEEKLGELNKQFETTSQHLTEFNLAKEAIKQAEEKSNDEYINTVLDSYYQLQANVENAKQVNTTFNQELPNSKSNTSRYILQDGYAKGLNEYSSQVYNQNESKLKPIMDSYGLTKDEMIGFIRASNMGKDTVDKQLIQNHLNEFLNPKTNVSNPLNNRQSVLDFATSYNGLKVGNTQTQANTDKPIKSHGFSDVAIKSHADINKLHKFRIPFANVKSGSAHWNGGVVKGDTIGFMQLLDQDDFIFKNSVGFTSITGGKHKKLEGKSHRNGYKIDLDLKGGDNAETYKKVGQYVADLAKKHGYIIQVNAEHGSWGKVGKHGDVQFIGGGGSHLDITVIGRTNGQGNVLYTTDNSKKVGKHSGIAKINQGTFVSYTNPDGTTTTKVGGTISWRNNNSGNLVYSSEDRAKRDGAIGIDTKGYAIFASEADGDKAREKVIKRNWGNLSIEGMIYKYAPPDDGKTPTLKGNNPAQYTASVVKYSGLSKDLKINDLSPMQFNALLSAMKKHEGYKVGKIEGTMPKSDGFTTDSNALSFEQDELATRALNIINDIDNEENNSNVKQLEQELSDIRHELENLKQSEIQPVSHTTDEVEQVREEKAKELFARASVYTAEQIDNVIQSGILSQEQVDSLRMLSDVKRMQADLNRYSDVTREIENGRKGDTPQASHIGLNQYTDILNNAIVKQDLPTINTNMYRLENFVKGKVNKANALKQALAMNPDIETNPLMILPDKKGNWNIVQGRKGNDKQLHQAGAIDVLKPLSTNVIQFHESIFNEAVGLQTALNTYQDYITSLQNQGILTKAKLGSNGSTIVEIANNIVLPDMGQQANSITSTPQATPQVTPQATEQVASNKPSKPVKNIDTGNDNIKAVYFSKVVDYERADDEVWVGRGYEKDENGNSKPVKSLSSFTDLTLANGDRASGRLFNADSILEMGALGNPYSVKTQGAWNAKNETDAFVKYTDLVKSWANTTDPKRTRFLEDLMSLRGKKLVTSQYEINEAKFIDEIVNNMPQDLADSLINIDPDLSNKQRLAQTKEAREWVERIAPKVSGTKNIQVRFEHDTRPLEEITKQRKERQPNNRNFKPKQTSEIVDNPTLDEYELNRPNLDNVVLTEEELNDFASYTNDSLTSQVENVEQVVEDIQPTVESVETKTAETPKNSGITSKHKAKEVKQAPQQMSARQKAKKLEIDMSNPVGLYEVIGELINNSKSKHKEHLGGLIKKFASLLDNPTIQYGKQFGIDDNAITIKDIKDPLEKLAQLLVKDGITGLSNELALVNDYTLSQVENEYQQLLDKKGSEDLEVIGLKEDLNYQTKLYHIKRKLQIANTAIINYGILDFNDKEKINQILTNPELMLSVGLTDKNLVNLFKQIKVKVKPRDKRKTNVFNYLLNTVKDFFGLNEQEISVFELLVTTLGEITHEQFENQTKGKKAKLSVLDVSDEFIQANLDVPYGKRNEFVIAFNQGSSTELSRFKDFGKALSSQTDSTITQVLNRDVNQNERDSIDDFIDFKENFTVHLLASFENSKGYEYKDLKGYLYNQETGEIDDNVVTALAYSAYNWLAVNGGKALTTYDDVAFLLNVPKDSNPHISRDIYLQYEDVLGVLPVIASEIGTNFTKLLDIQETQYAKRGSLSDLQMSVGNWVISALQVAGLAETMTMDGNQHLANMSAVGGVIPDKLALTDWSTVNFVKFTKFITDDNQTVNHERVEQINQTNKHSQGVLNELFDVEIGLRFPKLVQPTKVKRTVKGMKTMVSNLQATFINKMQKEAIEIDTGMYDSMSNAMGQFYDEFVSMIGASITDEELSKLHKNERESAESKAEGYKRELENSMGFINSLKRDKTGFQKFYDSIYVAKNNRMHFNSNVFNMQTSIISRMLASYENFKTTIDVTGVTFDNLVSHALDNEGKPTLIGLYLRALGTNLEGSEDFFKAKHGKAYSAYTVDKLKSSVFIPTFVEYLNTKEVQDAINAMVKLQANEKLTKKEIKAIKAFVKSGDMGIQSFRALVELANLKKSMETGSLTTSLGLGSDGVNNGIAIGSVYNAIGDTKTLIQLGFIPKDNQWLIEYYYDSREHQDIGDYYEAYAQELKRAIDNADFSVDETKLLNTIVKLQPTLYTRKFAKNIVIPFGYSAGIGRLVQVAQETFINDIQKQLANLANNFNEKAHTDLENNLKVFLGDKFVLPKEPNELLEFWFDKNQESKIMGIYGKLLGSSIKTSLESFASEFIDARSQNVAMHEATFNLFYDVYQAIVNQASNELADELKLTADEFIKRGFTNQEWDDRVVTQIKKVMPKVKNAFATTQGDIQNDESIEQIDEIETGIEVFARNTRFVANRQSSKTNRNNNGVLQAITIKLPAKEKMIESAGVFVNSAQIQGTDGRISAEASSMLDGFVNLNIHDQNDSGLSHYLDMVKKQNKVTFEVLATNHIQLNSLETLVDMVVNTRKLVDDGLISEEQFQESMEILFTTFDVNSIDYRLVLRELVDKVTRLEQRKLGIMAKLGAVHQYAGELGHHVVSETDLKLLESQKKVVSERINKVSVLLKDSIGILDTDSFKTIPKSMEEITNHSGGAYGADIIWDKIGRQFGVDNHKHYYLYTEKVNEFGEVVPNNPPFAGTHITDKDKEVGKFASMRGGKRMFGATAKSTENPLLIRNYSQVKYADAVFAVTSLVGEGGIVFPNIKEDERVAFNPTATGGTGYAVNMAIGLGKPVYVFNQLTDDNYPIGWYEYDYVKNDFIAIDTPTLTKNFAGIGTRKLNDLGQNAIIEVYKKTYELIHNESFDKYVKTFDNKGNYHSVKDRLIFEEIISKQPKTNFNTLSSQSQSILENYTNGSEISIDLFNKLVNINPNQKITLLNKDTVVGSGLTDVGMFFDETNEIKVNVESELWYATPLEAINHELIHSVTRDVINTGKYDSQIEILRERIGNALLNGNISVDENGFIADRIMYFYNSNHELLTDTLAENQIRTALPKDIVDDIESLFNQIVGEFNANTRPNQPKSREDVKDSSQYLSSSNPVQSNGQQSSGQDKSDDNNQRNAQSDDATTSVQIPTPRANQTERLGIELKVTRKKVAFKSEMAQGITHTFEGYKVEIPKYPKAQLVVHRSYNNDKLWFVSEVTTGKTVVTDNSKENNIEHITYLLKDKLNNAFKSIQENRMPKKVLDIYHSIGLFTEYGNSNGIVQVTQVQVDSSLIDKPFTLQSGLDKLLVNADTYSANLTKRFVQLIPDTKINIVTSLDSIPEGLRALGQSGGVYDTTSKITYIYSKSEEWEGSLIELINHELTHRVTADVIGFDDIPSRLNDEQRNQAENLQEALFLIIQNNELPSHIQDRIANAIAVNPPHELVAILTAETQVRKAVKNINPEIIRQFDIYVKGLVEIGTNANLYQRTDIEINTGIPNQEIPVNDERATAEVSTDTSGNSTSSNSQRDVYSNQTNQSSDTQKPSRINNPKEFIDKLLNDVTNADKSQITLVNYLLPKLVNSTGLQFEWVNDLTHENNPAYGLYFPATNVIQLNSRKWKDLSDFDKVALVLHESIHALTEQSIKKPNKKQQEAIQVLEDMRKQLIFKTKDEDILKRLENINEFIAYGLTDKLFMNFITDNLDTSNIPLANRIANGLSEFFKQVLDLFNWFGKGNQATMEKQKIYKTFVNNAMALVQAIDNPNNSNTVRTSQVFDVVADIEVQAKVLQGEPVSNINEDTLDMPKSGGFKAIDIWATDLFEQQGNKATNPVLGDVVLNHRSVKDSLAHGKFSPFKNLAFAGVKDVIEKGVIIAKDKNEFKEDSYYISAPVLINGNENIITVNVHRDSNSQRMYLHSVKLKENLLKPQVSATLEKNSRTHYGLLTSTDIHNILQKALTFNSHRASVFNADNMVNEKAAVEVLKDMPTSVSDTFNQHLDKLLDNVGKFYEYNSNNKRTVDKAVKKQSNANLIAWFGLDSKQLHSFEVMKAVIAEYINNQTGTIAVNDIRKIYQESKEQLSYEDFLSANPTDLEIQIAKQTFDSLFDSRNGKDYLANFVALSLTSEKFNQVLDKKREYIQRDVNRAWFDRLMRIFDTVVNFFTGLYLHKNGNVNQQLLKLTQRLATVDVNARNEQAGMLQTTWEWIGKGFNLVNTVIHKAVVYMMRKLANSNNIIGETIATPFIMADNLKHSDVTLSEVFAERVGHKNKRFGEFRNIVNETFNSNNMSRIMEKMVRYTQKVAQSRQQIKSALQKDMLSHFNNKELSEEDRSVLTNVIMRSDLGGLLQHMNMAGVLSMATNKVKRDERISVLEQRILEHKMGNDMLMQAKSLSAYMTHGVTPTHLVKSSEAIALQAGIEVNDISQLNQALYKDIDVLVSLYALNNLGKDVQIAFDFLVQDERKAIENIIKQHSDVVKQSKEDFKHNPLSYIKGYTPDILNPYRSLKWVHADEVADLENQGWEVITTDLTQDSLDNTDKRVLMFHQDINYQRRVSGALDLSDSHSKGTVVYNEYDFTDLQRVSKERINQRMARNQMSYQDFNPFNETGGMVMNVNPDGYIIDFHYEMQGFVKDKWLERNNDIFDLLPTMASNLQFKEDIKNQRAILASVIHKDYLESYHKNPELFVVIDPESLDPKVQEDYALMPYDFRQALKKQFGNKPIVVRASVYNTVFGYKAWSIGKMFDKTFDDRNVLEKLLVGLFGSVLGDKAQSRVVQIERVIQFITTLAKDMIVIRSGKVLLGNIIANLLLLGMHGVRPDVIIKDTLFAWREGQRYGKLQNRLYEIEFALKSARGDERKALNQEKHEIKADMAKHPMRDYMNAGMMSTIVEDTVIFKDKPDFVSIWEEKINAVTDKIPKPVKDTFDWIVINPNTPVYKFLADATQFSDFSAKYVLAKHLQSKGMSFDKAISEAQESFINYDVPTGQGMDYMNRMGLFMFTKFFLRFQKVLAKAFIHKPAQMIIQHELLESGLDMQGILDPAMALRIGNNPFEASALSIFATGDDLMTYQIVSGAF